MASVLARSEEYYCRKPEYIIAEISLGCLSKLLVAVVYRPPNYGFLSEFKDMFLNLQINYKHSIIMRDFNSDMSVDTYDSRQIETFVEASNMFLVPYNATHHLKNSSTLLDLCIIDDPNKLIDFAQHDINFLSAHDLIHITYDVKIPKKQPRFCWYRDFAMFDENEFKNDIINKDWTTLFEADTVDSKVSILNTFINECFDRHAPLTQRIFKHSPAPWMTTEIREARRCRDRLRRIWRKKRDTTSHERFRQMRNKAQNLIRTAKQNYFLSTFNGNDCPSNTWCKLRHLGLIKSGHSDGRLAHGIEELNTLLK